MSTALSITVYGGALKAAQLDRRLQKGAERMRGLAHRLLLGPAETDDHPHVDDDGRVSERAPPAADQLAVDYDHVSPDGSAAHDGPDRAEPRPDGTAILEADEILVVVGQQMRDGGPRARRSRRRLGPIRLAV